MLDHHRAASAATLSTARDIDINPRFARGIDDQSAVPRLDDLFLGFELNLLRDDRRNLYI
jgi:hypothetical protein